MRTAAAPWPTSRAILALDGDDAGCRPAVRFDPSLARGLSYYTGAIMEINVADLAGSLGGGGRYDNLVGMFLGQSDPRLRLLARPRAHPGRDGRARHVPAGAGDDAGRRHDRRCSTPPTRPRRCALAAQLRAAGLRVLVYPDADKIGKQIKYADSRGIPFVAILGGDEIAAGTVTVKDLAGQTQHDIRSGRGGCGDSRGTEATWLSNSGN